MVWVEPLIQWSRQTTNIFWWQKVSQVELEEFRSFIKDASLFVWYFGIALAKSAPHVYISALPIAPKNSLVYAKYSSLFPHTLCYVLVERSARLELDGYDSVVWHVALGACASSTLWEQMDWWNMDGTGLRGRGRCPRRTRWSGGICMSRASQLDWHENSDLRSKSATGTS